jgi:hypothetical protein
VTEPAENAPTRTAGLEVRAPVIDEFLRAVVAVTGGMPGWHVPVHRVARQLTGDDAICGRDPLAPIDASYEFDIGGAQFLDAHSPILARGGVPERGSPTLDPMRGTYGVVPDAGRPGTYVVTGEDGLSLSISPRAAQDPGGEQMVVDRMRDMILVADRFTGRAAVVGKFVTEDICRPPAAVTRFPDLRHFAIEGPGIPRAEYHLGSGADSSLGFILTPDGRPVTRIDANRRTDQAEIDVIVDVEWATVLAALHLTMFASPPPSLLDRVRRRLRRRGR